jgi:hypothetical protein
MQSLLITYKLFSFEYKQNKFFLDHLEIVSSTLIFLLILEFSKKETEHISLLWFDNVKKELLHTFYVLQAPGADPLTTSSTCS